MNTKTDKRYTIAREYCGKPEPRYIARFCGEWLGQSANKNDARAICESHYNAQPYNRREEPQQ